MKAIKFIVEKTSDGYSAYSEIPGKGVAATVGSTISELKANALEAYNALLFELGKPPIPDASITLTFDLAQFFDYYKIINVKALAERIHMNRALLSHYANGHKKASPKQTERILKGVKEVAKELYESDFV
jgi:hypothetical protein